MKTCALLFVGLATMIVPLLPVTPAQAQNAKAYVSTAGNDSMNCTLTAPCATFGGAINKTLDGGEVACLDPGPFPAVGQITKSVTLDCGETGGTIVVGSNFGIQVNTAGINVTIRNLTINGVFSAAIGVSLLTGGSSLNIQNCAIRNFHSGAGIGILFQPVGSASKLYVTDTVVQDNGVPSSGGGIIIQPVGSGSAQVVLNRVQVENNFQGILADGTGSTGVILVEVRDSVVAGNLGHGIAAISSAGHSPTGVIVDRTSSAFNAASGILAQGAAVHLGNSTVTGNATGLNVAGGQILSYQNNQTSGNFNDGAPTGVLTLR
jgi:hypothetical protein